MSFVPWILFLVLVFALLALDLGVLNKNIHEITTKEALKWTVFWIALSFVFSGILYLAYDNHWLGIGIHEGASESGIQAWTDYVTGYLIEKALSLDNIAVMAMVFAAFKIELKYQHRVLFWGILGALVFRGIMIGVGAALVSQFEWVLYIFGAFLFYVAIKSTFTEEDEVDPKDKWYTKFLLKHFRYTLDVEGMHFFRRIDGKLFMTPFIVCLLVIEISDIIFAVDSIPAIFGITTDPFIVFTSNIFAILGLRSLYFVLASILDKFRLLKYAVGVILMFVAVKLLIPAGYDIYNLVTGANVEKLELPNWTSLVTVVVCIFFGIVGSIWYDKRHPVDEAEKSEDKGESSEAEAEKSEAKEDKAEKSEDKGESSEAEAEKSEDEVEKSEDKTEKSEDKAESSEAEAEKSKDEAGKSEDEAEKSEAKAEKSEAKAEKSEDEAEKSEAKAEKSEAKQEEVKAGGGKSNQNSGNKSNSGKGKNKKGRGKNKKK